MLMLKHKARRPGMTPSTVGRGSSALPLAGDWM